MSFILIFMVTFVVFMGVDLIWLGVIAKSLYKKHLGYFMAEKPNWYAAVLFYVLFNMGLIYFAVYPALTHDSGLLAFLNGGLYGFFTYVTYDLTNLATLKKWPVKIVVIDITWGTMLGMAVSYISYVVITAFHI